MENDFVIVSIEAIERLQNIFADFDVKNSNLCTSAIMTVPGVIGDCQNLICNAENQLEKVKYELYNERERERTLIAEINKSRDALEQSQSEKERINSAIPSVENEIRSLSNEIYIARGRFNQLNNSAMFAATAEEANYYRTLAEQENATVGSLDSRLSNSQSQLSQLQEQRNEIENNIYSLRNSIDKMKRNLSDCQIKIREFETRQSRYESKINRMKNYIVILEQKINSYCSEINRYYLYSNDIVCGVKNGLNECISYLYEYENVQLN